MNHAQEINNNLSAKERILVQTCDVEGMLEPMETCIAEIQLAAVLDAIRDPRPQLTSMQIEESTRFVNVLVDAMTAYIDSFTPAAMAGVDDEMLKHTLQNATESSRRLVLLFADGKTEFREGQLMGKASFDFQSGELSVEMNSTLAIVIDFLSTFCEAGWLGHVSDAADFKENTKLVLELLAQLSVRPQIEVPGGAGDYGCRDCRFQEWGDEGSEDTMPFVRVKCASVQTKLEDVCQQLRQLPFELQQNPQNLETVNLDLSTVQASLDEPKHSQEQNAFLRHEQMLFQLERNHCRSIADNQKLYKLKALQGEEVLMWYLNYLQDQKARLQERQKRLEMLRDHAPKHKADLEKQKTDLEASRRALTELMGRLRRQDRARKQQDKIPNPLDEIAKELHESAINGHISHLELLQKMVQKLLDITYEDEIAQKKLKHELEVKTKALKWFADALSTLVPVLGQFLLMRLNETDMKELSKLKKWVSHEEATAAHKMVETFRDASNMEQAIRRVKAEMGHFSCGNCSPKSELEVDSSEVHLLRSHLADALAQADGRTVPPRSGSEVGSDGSFQLVYIKAPSSIASAPSVKSAVTLASWISAAPAQDCEPRCFLSTSLLQIEDSYAMYWLPASKLQVGFDVRGVHKQTRVHAIEHLFAQECELVELHAGDSVPPLTVTASHRVVTSIERSSTTKPAGELQAGDQICTSNGPKPLHAVRKSNHVVDIVKVTFKPDEPVEAYDWPLATILTKGNHVVRRGGGSRRGGRLENVSNIPDTEYVWPDEENYLS